MTNFSVQDYLNRGYAPIDQQTLSVGNSATQIPPPISGICSAIMIAQIEDPQTNQVYLGNSSVTDLNGFPIFDFNTGLGTEQTPGLFILTSDPELFYLFANISTDVRILYLGVRT